MPGMPEVMSKPLMLERLDRLFEDPTRRTEFARDLQSMDLYEIAVKYKIADSDPEKWHLREDWFRSWWPTAQRRPGGVKAVMHEGFRLLCEMVERNPKPVDFYWVCDPGHEAHSNGHHDPHHPDDGDVEVSVSWSDAQFTFILQTPHPPVDSQTGPVLEDIFVVRRKKEDQSIERVQASRPESQGGRLPKPQPHRAVA